uniref:3-oxo-5-alpha-steroid 4-dehydrogenase 2-like isoform X2 n=1 Tax=Petromyzon marinus TaxID=7757 RepID=A0AAJ7SRZ4_PETMA|nr:3-oxo-5-alpha-steroid 4-dehydrogenase 2-like isoform X2 [Petromyzon marinus]
MSTHCNEVLVTWMGLCMAAAGVLNTLGKEMAYGRFWDREGRPRVMLPARLAWCTQEMPSLAVPVILLLVHVGSSERGSVDTVNIVHLAMFCGHYFQRTFIFSLLSRGRPTSLSVMVKAFVFCTLNGYLQSYNLLKCKSYPSNWLTDARFLIGSIIFLAGVAMNIHSDWILRNLRKPGEYVYRIPRVPPVPVRALLWLQEGCSSWSQAPTSWARLWSGSATPWPPGPSLPLPSLFSPSVASGLVPCTTTGGGSRSGARVGMGHQATIVELSHLIL